MRPPSQAQGAPSTSLSLDTHQHSSASHAIDHEQSSLSPAPNAAQTPQDGARDKRVGFSDRRAGAQHSGAPAPNTGRATNAGTPDYLGILKDMYREHDMLFAAHDSEQSANAQHSGLGCSTQQHQQPQQCDEREGAGEDGLASKFSASPSPTSSSLSAGSSTGSKPERAGAPHSSLSSLSGISSSSPSSSMSTSSLSSAPKRPKHRRRQQHNNSSKSSSSSSTATTTCTESTAVHALNNRAHRSSPKHRVAKSLANNKRCVDRKCVREGVCQQVSACM